MVRWDELILLHRGTNDPYRFAAEAMGEIIPWKWSDTVFYLEKYDHFENSSSSPCFFTREHCFFLFFSFFTRVAMNAAALKFEVASTETSSSGKSRQSFQLLQSQSLELPSQVGFRAWLQSNTFELLIAVALLLNVSWKMLGFGDQPTLKVNFCSKEGIVYTCLYHNCSMILIGPSWWFETLSIF